jgi:flagellar protein FlaG
MEITNIKENMISPSLQGLSPGSVKKPGQRDEQAGRSEAATELLKDVSKGDKGDPEAIKAIVENVNRVIEAMRYNIQFVVDQESGGVIIKVVDGEGKLIRQIPPEGLAALSSDTLAGLGLLLNREL